MRIEGNAVTLPALDIVADGGLQPRQHPHNLRRIPCATAPLVYRAHSTLPQWPAATLRQPRAARRAED